MDRSCTFPVKRIEGSVLLSIHEMDITALVGGWGIGWLVAAIPLAAYFISNWFTVGGSTYFRILPSFCIAALPQLTTQTAVGICFVFIILAAAIKFESIVMTVLLLGAADLVLITALALTTIRKEVQPSGFIVLAAGWLVFIGSAICVAITSHVAPLTSTLLVVGKVAFSAEEIILQITFMCAAFYIAGYFEASARCDFLVDKEKGLVVLHSFADNRAYVGKISEIRFSNNTAICFLENEYEYTTLCGMNSRFVWMRMRVEVNRENGS